MFPDRDDLKRASRFVTSSAEMFSKMVDPRHVAIGGAGTGLPSS